MVEPFAFKRTGDADFPKQIKSLILGPPKAGKTSMLATFPNIVIADVEAGLMSIAHRNVPYVTIDGSDKLQTLLFVLRDDTMRAKAAQQMGMERIESVGIDTMDALQELYKRERLAKERRTQFEQKDWGWLLDQFRELIRSFTALPLHVAFTVHTKTTQDDEGRVIHAPGLQGAIGEEIAGMVGFSVLMNRTREVDPNTGLPYTSYSLKVEGDERNPHLGHRAADRLPPVVAPSFQTLYDAVYKGLELAPTQEGQVDPDGQGQGVPQQQPAAPQVPAPQQTGVQIESTSQVAQTSGQPPSDENQQVTEVALGHLRKLYTEWGLVLPETATTWTLGFAREVARMFVAVNEDMAKGNLTNGRQEGEEMLRGFLQSQQAYQDPATAVPAGNVDEVLAWVGDDQGRARKALDAEEAGKRQRVTLTEALKTKLGIPTDKEKDKAAQPAPQQAPPQQAPQAPAPAESAPEPTPAQPEPANPSPEAAEAEGTDGEITHDQAVENLKEGLGAQVVEDGKDPDSYTHADLRAITHVELAPPCEQGGEPINDLDIAKLSLSRFGKWLCVEDYVAQTKDK